MGPSSSGMGFHVSPKNDSWLRRATWPGNVETGTASESSFAIYCFCSFSLLFNPSPSKNVDAFRVRGQVNKIMLVKHFAPRKRFLCKHEILLDIIKPQPCQQWPSQGWALFLIYCLAKLGFFSPRQSVGGLLLTGVGDSLISGPYHLPLSSTNRSFDYIWLKAPFFTSREPQISLCIHIKATIFREFFSSVYNVSVHY